MTVHNFIISSMVTVVAVVLASSATDVFSSDKYLSDNYTNIEFSDFYSKLGKQSGTPISQNTAVVSVDGCSRSQLASIIDTLNTVADVICLDILFKRKEPQDSILISKINSCDNIVLPYVLAKTSEKYIESDSSYFYKALDTSSVHYGAVNLNAEKVGDIIRRFKSEFDLANGKKMDSFATAAIRCYAKVKKNNSLKSLPDELKQINFHNVEIPKYSVSDILQNKDVLRGRLVLLGYDENLSDRHNVPVHGSLSGVVIHAYIIETILSGKYVSENIGWIDFPLAILVTFFFSLFVCYVRE